MRAAVAALRKQGARRIVIAAAVAPPSVCEELRREADEVICTLEPDPFFAISLWYENFPQVTDEEVRRLLEAAERGYCMTASADATHGTSTTPS
jgi:putative phosphoribosyl transferase